jgi:4-amino-4-deoxy-L-arabinose transferase-like glycosyltransferase
VTPAASPRRRDRVACAGLAGLVAAVWLALLPVRPLFNPDEGRYAEIPREMLASGDFIIPHLDGLDYIEKPPLQYWVTALLYRVLGQGAFAARLCTALAALGCLLVVFGVAGRFWGRAQAWRAGAVLASLALFPLLGQLLTLDMSLCFCMTLALAAFLHAQRAPPAVARGWMLLAWAATAGGVLTKGLVAALIPAAVLALYTLLARDAAPWRRLNVRQGLPVFALLCVPWFWLAARRLPGFLEFFFVREHFARYLTPIADRREPAWFFAAVLLAGTLPWTLAVLRVVWSGWRRRMPAGEFDATVFLWVWVVFVLGFFSVSDSKLIPYVLPAWPALALLMAASPAEAWRRDLQRAALIMLLLAAVMAAGALYLRGGLPPSDRREYFAALSGPLWGVGAVLGAAGAVTLALLRRDAPATVIGTAALGRRESSAAAIGTAALGGRDPPATAALGGVALRGTESSAAAVVLGAGGCLGVLLLMRAAALVAPIYSGAGLAAAIPIPERSAPIYSVATYDQTLPFYLSRTVRLVAYRGELDFGLRWAPPGTELSVDEFVLRWTQGGRAFAVMESDMFEQLQRRGMPMRIVARDVQHILVERS